MKLLCALCFTAPLACVTHIAATAPLPEPIVAQINAKGPGDHVILAARGEKPIEALAVTARPESIEWLTPRGNGAFPASHLESITIVDRERGAIEGLVAGLAAGIVVGIATAHAVAQADEGPCPAFQCLGSSFAQSTFAGLGAGTLTALVATVAGSAVGHRTVIDVAEPAR